jgi:hypothetical protein
MSVLAAPGGDPSAANSMATPDAITVHSSVLDPFDHSAPIHFPAMSVTILEFMIGS